VDDVLAFWFGEPARDEAELMNKVRRWFRGGPEMDAEVIAKFGPTVEAALAGSLDSWTATARGRLALVIVLDQFTRNVFRNDPKTYAGDERAQQLALEAFDRGIDRELEFVERMFLSMPLLHAENSALQDRVSKLANGFAKDCPPPYAKMSAMHMEQTTKYREIVRRFGHFPHRNAILGRSSTPDEIEFLRDWSERQAPTGSPRE
jgi:uncharacterized protein (DUF924 family)